MAASDDEVLVEAAAELAKMQSDGFPVPPRVLSLITAIAATRDEQSRHALALQAAERAGELTTLGLQVLRTVIFGLAVVP